MPMPGQAQTMTRTRPDSAVLLNARRRRIHVRRIRAPYVNFGVPWRSVLDNHKKRELCRKKSWRLAARVVARVSACVEPVDSEDEALLSMGAPA